KTGNPAAAAFPARNGFGGGAVAGAGPGCADRSVAGAVRSVVIGCSLRLGQHTAGRPVGADRQRAQPGRAPCPREQGQAPSRNALRTRMIAVIARPAAVVSGRLTKGPITDRRVVNSISGTIANGRPKDSTTWLNMSASVGSLTRARMVSAGTAEMMRRSQTL